MLKLLMIIASLFLASCFFGRGGSNDPEKTNDVMITFVQRAQAGFWREAMEHITKSESDEMMDGNGQVYPEYQAAISRIRLSTVKNMDLRLDSRGRLVGLRDILDDSNEKYVQTDEKVMIDVSKLEDLSKKRQKEEEEEAKKNSENLGKETPSDWEAYLKDFYSKEPPPENEN
jgi:basic membrane lipoprotein Med (substrate-binding protein (PBP1-ABC) superfamily)